MSIHLYDAELKEVIYDDGRVEAVPEHVVRFASRGKELDVVRMWAKLTKRVGPHDDIASPVFA
jgi:hypothetical protein